MGDTKFGRTHPKSKYKVHVQGRIDQLDQIRYCDLYNSDIVNMMLPTLRIQSNIQSSSEYVIINYLPLGDAAAILN